MAKQRAALVAILGQPMALADGREGLVRAIAASYDGGRGLRPLSRPASRRVAGAGTECVPGEEKIARRLARKLLARRLDVGIFAPLSEPSDGGECPASSECVEDATSSLGGRCVEVTSSFARQRRLQGVQDDLGGYECSGVDLGECCEAYRSLCEDCVEDPSADYCYPEVIAQYCDNAQVEGTFHYSQACVDFFEGGAASPPATPPAITTTVPQEIEWTPVTSGGISTEEEEERKFQICQANCPDISVCDCIYSEAPSATYNNSTCVSTIASSCRSGTLPSCRETGEVTFEDLFYCPLYECYENVGELIEQCYCGSYKRIFEYCDEDSSAEVCNGDEIMSVCENAPVNGTYHYSQLCTDYFDGVLIGTTASAATESTQTTDATAATATEESTTATAAIVDTNPATTAQDTDATTTATVSISTSFADEGGDPTTQGNATTMATAEATSFISTDANESTDLTTTVTEGTDPTTTTQATTVASTVTMEEATVGTDATEDTTVAMTSNQTTTGSGEGAEVTTVATEASDVSTTAAKSESTTTAATQGTAPTTKATIDGLGFADTDGGSPPSSAVKAAIGSCAAALAALSMGISHRW